MFSLVVLHVLVRWTSLVHRPLSAFPSTPDIGGAGRGRERSARTQSLEPNRSLHFFALLAPTCYTPLRLKLGSKTDLLYMDTVRAVPTQIPKYTVPWSQMGPAILLQSQTYYLDHCRTIVQCIYVDFALCFDIIIRNVCTAVSLHLPESVPWAFLTCDDAMLKKEM